MFATRSIRPSAAFQTQKPLQWNIPTPGVSLGYTPQQQVIGDPRNAAVIAAATAPRPAPVAATVQSAPRSVLAPKKRTDPNYRRERSSDSRAGGFASGRGLY